MENYLSMQIHATFFVHTFQTLSRVTAMMKKTQWTDLNVGTPNKVATGHAVKVWKHHDSNWCHVYKTTLYDLALFFITVKTNAGYTVAAELSYRQRLMNRLKKHLTFGNHGILTGHHNTLCLIIVKQKYWVLSQLFQLLILFHGLFTLSSCR